MFIVSSPLVWYNGTAKIEGKLELDLTKASAFWGFPILAEKKVTDRDGSYLMQTGSDDAAWYAWAPAESVATWTPPVEVVEVQEPIAEPDEPTVIEPPAEL